MLSARRLTTLVALLCLTLGTTALADVAWSDLSVDDAIRQGADDGRRAMVYVTATWCGPCKKLQADVWDSSYGDGVAASFVPVQVDWNTDAGREMKERWKVKRLPTVVVFDGTGRDVGRIVGYPGKDNFEKRLDAMRPSGAVPMDPTFDGVSWR